MPEHARTAPKQSSATTAAWAVLIGMGGTTVTFNIFHAVHAGQMLTLLALLYGIAPVFAAMGLSHIVAAHKAGWFLQAATFAVMLGAMALSIGAVAAVVGPTGGPVLRWLFGAVLDAAALIALRVILSGHERNAAESTALQAAERTAAEASGAAQDAAGKALALEADLVAVSAELTAANGALQALRMSAPSPRSRRSAGGAPKARRSADTADLTVELRALQMLDAHPELRSKGQATELARKLGISPGYGRKLHLRLTAEERPGGAPQERSGERSQEHAEERSSRPAQERE